MRTITGQKDYGLEPKVIIEADDRDDFGGGTSNYYWLHALIGDERKVFAEIQFQHGPRNDPASKPGIADSDMLHMLIDRYEGFQAGPFECEENAVTLQLLQQTLASTRVRADRRKAQGVLGQNKQHVSESTEQRRCDTCGRLSSVDSDGSWDCAWDNCDGGEPQIEMLATKSSHIAAIGYDELTREIHVEFNDGNRYAYEDADKGVFASFKLASSTGVFFQNYVKGRYKARKLEAT